MTRKPTHLDLLKRAYHVKVGAVDVAQVFLGVKIQSNPNIRRHWQGANKVKHRQQTAVFATFATTVLPPPPVNVNIVRMYAGRQREFDDDNLVAGAKGIRDAIAAMYGLDDGNKEQIKFSVLQVGGATQPNTYVRIISRFHAHNLSREAAASVALDGQTQSMEATK